MQGAPDRESVDTSAASPEMTPWLASQIQKVIDGIYNKYRHIDDGTVATYIPELGKANPKDFGICLATTEGRVLHGGRLGQGIHDPIHVQALCIPVGVGTTRNRRDAEARRR